MINQAPDDPTARMQSWDNALRSIVVHNSASGLDNDREDGVPAAYHVCENGDAGTKPKFETEHCRAQTSSLSVRRHGGAGGVGRDPLML